ncbi:MAG: pseudouridine synthase [Ketobacteraceae bacterium]|nr:pseudouridine synthase [Ketobacteraceae bacterium]
MRLDKFLSHTTDLSRSEAKRAIKSGRVTVNQHTATSGNQPVQAEDTVCLDQREVTLQGARYFMLFKPAGYVCASHDPDHPVVMDLITEPARNRLHVAGRLDKDTTGLVLITDDGQWSHRATAPGKNTFKRYRVEVAEPVTPDSIKSLEAGIQLKNEDKPTLPARVIVLDERKLLLSINEGRYHQVKRMLAATGNRVTALHREAVGAIELDPELPPGHYRPLSEAEINSF